jgi:hypothetical protein
MGDSEKETVQRSHAEGTERLRSVGRSGENAETEAQETVKRSSEEECSKRRQ